MTDERRKRRDVVPGGVLALLGVATVAIIAITIGVVDLLGGAVSTAAPPPPRERSAVEVHDFGLETDAERERREAGQRLRSWGWIDRNTGRIHVPLDVAVELYLNEQERAP
ncbi:MAG: hypothetical protein K8M05_32355 [Deltaproteobacteria bacterium]|nr:hypothetical protein [Kofleriaceae bacterium]